MKKSSYLELRICFFVHSYNVIKILKMFNKRNVVNKKLMKSKNLTCTRKKKHGCRKDINVYNNIQRYTIYIIIIGHKIATHRMLAGEV